MLTFGNVSHQFKNASDKPQNVQSRMFVLGFSEGLFGEQTRAHEALDNLLRSQELLLHDK